MSKKKKKIGEVCPICSAPYGKGHTKTRHHIFPKWWYKNGITVLACSKCHQKEFHIKYRMRYGEMWTPSECLMNWVKFCKQKGKDAFVIYPELCNIEPLY